MPDPVTANPWSSNPWASDTERQTAADGERAGGEAGRWAASLSDLVAEVPASTSSPDDSEPVRSGEDAYESLVADWPNVPPLISRHLTTDDADEMHKYWQEHWKNTKKADDQIQCFDKARYQLHIAGFDTTGNPYDETSYFQLFVETDNGDGGRVDVSDIPRTSEAILYLKDKLTHGIPVMVGIRMSGYDRRPNPDGTTNHFVVIVGMGRDEDATSLEPKYFFRYFDYLIPETMEFYVFNFPTLMLASSSGRRRVAQVRKTVRE